ncbi:MAG: GNAT family N-acetyltransferase [Rhodobiaceae bacterium]|jgi:ribosomal protein S18 acetylase RimI-like enzyme|nr:GNAT family N-acetyltransferase [Rhodobiaceae bacterium]
MRALRIERAENREDLLIALEDLTEILHGCVHAGASIGFVLPFSHSNAQAFWIDQVCPAIQKGETCLLLARDAGRVLGTVQLGLAMPSNQPHRADVAKMLVHPDARRRGIARALMRALEQEARARRKTLLVLDTRSGDAAAQLYASEGFRVAGEIPGYCRNPFDDRFEATTYMFKALA